MTDAQLIENYLSGNIVSFNTLVKRWEKPLFNFSYRYLGDFELAKDVTQKVFIRIYKSLTQLKDHDKFSSWVYRIASNLCKDELKTLQKKNMVSIDCINENDKNTNHLLEKSFIEPDVKMSQMQLEQLIKQALKAIPEEQRVVIIMKEYQGLKFTEIAEALGEPVNTVKSRMYYGLNALRKVFERWNINSEVVQYEM